MKNIFLISILMCLSTIVLYAQTYEDADRIQSYLDDAEYYFSQANYYEAKWRYESVLEIDSHFEGVSEIYYRLFYCCIGIERLECANFYYEKYKEVQPYNKLRIVELENSIKEYKNSRKIKKYNWNHEKLQHHKKFIGYEYSYANAGFERRNSNSYHTSRTGISIEAGTGSNPFSFVTDIGIYYIPYGFEDKSFWNFDTWSIRFGMGTRYIHSYPLFSLGGLCFRYTGYAGVSAEGLVNGGYMYGDSDTGFFNAWGYKVSSGLFISPQNIPRGLRLEAIYQGHQHFEDNPPLKYKPYFGIQVGIYLGY